MLPDPVCRRHGGRQPDHHREDRPQLPRHLRVGRPAGGEQAAGHDAAERAQENQQDPAAQHPGPLPVLRSGGGLQGLGSGHSRLLPLPESRKLHSAEGRGHAGRAQEPVRLSGGLPPHLRLGSEARILAGHGHQVRERDLLGASDADEHEADGPAEAETQVPVSGAVQQTCGRSLLRPGRAGAPPHVAPPTGRRRATRQIRTPTPPCTFVAAVVGPCWWLPATAAAAPTSRSEETHIASVIWPSCVSFCLGASRLETTINCHSSSDWGFYLWVALCWPGSFSASPGTCCDSSLNTCCNSPVPRHLL